VSTEALATAQLRLGEAVHTLRAAAESGVTTDDELLAVLRACESATRRLERAAVGAIATLSRRGVFAERGYKSSTKAVADLLGCEQFEARRRVTVADHVVPRVGLDGSVVPPRLPATAEVFDAGRASSRHVEVIARVLGSAAANRLAPQVWAGAEEVLAGKASEYTPCQLQAWGTELVEKLDQDGPEPDDRPPASVNELTVTRFASKPGGTIKGRFDDAALFDAIATAIDAHAKPLTRDDHRSAPQRQAEALADVCAQVLDRGEMPECGGRRPHLNVLIRLDDLENRARAAMLDFGGKLSPESLRLLACDAAVVPIVMNGAGQPLDVGRATRTIPDGLRRAVAARDRGCAHPGCDRPPSWCEIHHVVPWEDGGPTSLENLVMLCRAHHRQMHFTEWIVRIRDGLPEFIPPVWIDLERRPRRKPLPHLLVSA
jgi:Domain of unknown function (DUF222)/HNH endonuclease